uniref:MGS-like domain-containing protein n=1 Tax=Guillardia theta TaxID=55529 RepID=A0A7S4NFP7_GUITH
MSTDLVKIKKALISVSDKTDLLVLAAALKDAGVQVLSTGGTAKALKEAGLPVTDVSDYTGFPEMMDGRVKTLHPKVHGALLSIRNNPEHEKACKEHGIEYIDMLVVNLYPFQATVAKGADFDTCIENVDIGGPAMIRAASKNHPSVTVITSVTQYAKVIEEMKQHDGCTTLKTRRSLAAAAYAHTAAYDAAISTWFAEQNQETPAVVTRAYDLAFPLKYGCNPHQLPANIYSMSGGALPFKVLNGKPGYINLLDALNSWALVKEAREALGLPAAASFKHVSPAGAAVAVPLSDVEKQAYEAPDNLSPAALAYLRARNADPMCSFGDWAALSDVVDEQTANYLKTEVSDGIIAPGYTPEALAILSQKKTGSFIVLEADPNFKNPAGEIDFREINGCVFAQRGHGDKLITPDMMKKNISTKNKDLPEGAVRDQVLATVAIKYTQSNSVGYAINGMMIGVGAGQQSRVDCVKLAGRKVTTWWMRQHPKVLGLQFKPDVKRQARVNARVRYIEGMAEMTDIERETWAQQFTTVPEPLTPADFEEHMKKLDGVVISSDAFFPFRDSIDTCIKYGVKYVAQPGGSVQDEGVTEACDQYGMVQCHHGMRLFHH